MTDRIINIAKWLGGYQLFRHSLAQFFVLFICKFLSTNSVLQIHSNWSNREQVQCIIPSLFYRE